MKRLFSRIMPVMLFVSMVFVSCTVPDLTLEPTPNENTTPDVTSAASSTSILILTSTAEATTPTPTPTQLSDDVWDRIVANKKIIVGTSLDYPPFASIDPTFHAVGFDIAVSQEIGRRLNIPVEIQNFTFEGLPDALSINQIDLAVAAISTTSERASRMSFSPVYYVNQTAILAKTGSTITEITDFKQLAAYRIGVQRGTTYESMVQNLLIDPGLMSAAKVLHYIHSDEAIKDLIAGQVDVVVLGQATASYYGEQQELRVVGKGFDQQNLAVAMRLGTPRLKAEIDRVMEEMLTDGTILGFIQQYIESDVTGVLSTPISPGQATATAFSPVLTATAPVCVNGMKFVSDVTFGDNNMQNPPFVKPGETFVKTWRVENSGTCTWTPSYRLVYAYGNVPAAQMNGQPLNIPGDVAPGQLVDLSVTLVAPKDPLTYQGFWQIETDKGGRFGQTIWVAITTATAQANPTVTRPPSGYGCAVTNIPPKDAVRVGDHFDGAWTVKNISNEDWPIASVDYIYISGAKMHEKEIYDFTTAIKKNESGKIVVDMIAPDQPGIYSANWAIVSGNRTLCAMSVTVTVFAK